MIVFRNIRLALGKRLLKGPIISLFILLNERIMSVFCLMSIVAACLLHDYGHLVHDLGENIADQGVDAHHETLGANRLKKLFKPDVVEPVRLHVAAKRYLCWKDSWYYDGLSEASQQSLGLQGGPMTDEEGLQFEEHPFYQSAVILRKYDDMGKVLDLKTLDFEDFRNDLEPFVLIQNEIHEPK